MRRLASVLWLLLALPGVVGAGFFFSEEPVMDRHTPPPADTTTALSPSRVSLSSYYRGPGVSGEGPIVVPEVHLPVEFVVEQELVDRFGLDAVREGVRFLNGISGSRWSADVVGVVDDRAHGAADDDVWRIYSLPPGACGGTSTADQALNGVLLHGYAGAYTTDGDIGICPDGMDRTLFVRGIAHELGHVAGMGHIYVQGDPGWTSAMAPGETNRCRIMYPVFKSCTAVHELDREALRTLYPTADRLAGRTRTETAARTTFFRFDETAVGDADLLVVADGWSGSALPVAAAALAGAAQAPFLLVEGDGSCAAGSSPGDEVGRLAAPAATIVLAGSRVDPCASSLAASGYRIVRAGSVRAVADQLASRVGEPDGIVLVRSPYADGNLPDGVTAASLAGTLDDPILFADESTLTGETTAFLDAHPSVRHVTIIGGGRAVTGTVVDQLEARGLTVSRLSGATRIETSLAVAGHSALAGASTVLLAAADAWPDAVSGSALGATDGLPVVLSWPTGLGAGVTAFLDQRATRAYVVGGRAVWPDALQQEAGRHVG